MAEDPFAMSPGALTEEQALLFISLEGSEIARMICVAFFALLVYEWFITLDKEIHFFWSGPWNVSRTLFLMNRYLTLVVSIIPVLCFFMPNPTDRVLVRSSSQLYTDLSSLWAYSVSCRPALGTAFIANTVVMGLVQAMLAVRVWYLYSSSRLIQAVVVISLISSVVASLTLSGMAAASLRLLPGLEQLRGCHVSRPTDHWRLFIPTFLLHSLLFALTAMKALQSYRVFDNAPIPKRLFRDGGFFYLVAFLSIGFTVVGSVLREHTRLNIISIFSNFLIPINSIAVSRVMLSIHSLASTLGADSAWILNNVELSRVAGRWRAGSTPGEIIVETWRNVDEEYEMDVKPLQTSW